MSRAMGLGPAFFTTAVVIGLTNLLIPLASLTPKYALLCMGAAQLFGDAAWAIYAVNETTLRQRSVAPEVLGRVNAAMQLASRGVLPIGALAGGFLAEWLSIPAALWIGCSGVLLSCLFLLPLRGHVADATPPEPSAKT